MISLKYTGGCHCGNIAIEMVLTHSPDSYNPRACDCDFCRMHAASYISDPRGTLEIRIEDKSEFSKYRQGSGIAEFLVCKICGVLAGVSHHGNDGVLYSAVNSRIIQNAEFGRKTTVSPKLLPPQDRVRRWKAVWFSKVRIKGL